MHDSTEQSELIRQRPSHPIRRALPGLLACALLTVTVFGATACGSSGRELRDPAPGATAPPRKNGSTTTAANRVTADDSSVILRPSSFSISSPDWTPDGVIPGGLGCAGGDTSPALAITGVPDGTAELLLIASDTSDPASTRWIVAAIPASTGSIGAGTIPAGAVALINSTGTADWAGPCPERGSSTTFQLRLYALRTTSGITDQNQSSSVTTALTTASQAAVLRGSYSRPL